MWIKFLAITLQFIIIVMFFAQYYSYQVYSIWGFCANFLMECLCFNYYINYEFYMK